MLGRFLSDRGGNFALMFAFLSVPLVAAVGLAVDYTTASAQRTELHNASDGAALAIARAGQNVSQIQAERIAENFIRANYAGAYSDMEVSRQGETWTVSVEAEADTRFAGIIGMDKMAVQVVSSATYALRTYEIGLVLDTTGSMSGDKLEKLKEATTTLIDTMASEAGEAGNLQFSVVPFSTFVNVGPEFGPQFNGEGKVIRAGAEWLDLRGKNPIPQAELETGLSRFEVFHHLGQEWAGCVETRVPTNKLAYDVLDVPGEPKTKRSLFVPALSIDEPDPSPGDRPIYINSYLNDQGTTLRGSSKKNRLKRKYKIEMAAAGGGDDDDDDDDDDDEGGAVGAVAGVLGGLSDAVFGPPPAVDTSMSLAREPKGPNHDCTSAPILPLTDDYEAVKDHIETLEAVGSTNLLEGVMWGWRALSPGEPFAQGRPRSDANNQKIMIFLTDGANTWNQYGERTGNQLGSAYSSFGYAVDERLGAPAASGSVTARMDAKTESACTNAKGDGLIIYTIRLELKDSDTGDLLRRCASGADHYFDVPDASQLEEAFREIRNKIRQVRISS